MPGLVYLFCQKYVLNLYKQTMMVIDYNILISDKRDRLQKQTRYFLNNLRGLT